MKKIIRGYPVCEGCKFSHLLKCAKYNESCTSFNFNGCRYQVACLKCLQNDGYEEGTPDINTANGLIACMHMPGPENLDLFKSFILMKQHYPEAFYENRQITEIYGSFGGAIWNGRTPNFHMPCLTIEDIDQIRQDIEALGITMNLTWNNHLVSGTDVYDRFCNSITKVFHNGKHSITVASQELFDYLKEKYPNFTYYQSVISTSNDKVFTKKDNRYDMYLMNRNLNNNWEELLKVPMEERQNIEFLCNDACTPICHRMGHYNIVNACLLDRCDENCVMGNYCTIDHDFIRYNARTWPMTINPEDIDEYLDNGFCHFKLCSRGDIPPIMALKMAQYLAKPEFVDDVFGWAISGLTEPEEIMNGSKKQEEINDKNNN